MMEPHLFCLNTASNHVTLCGAAGYTTSTLSSWTVALWFHQWERKWTKDECFVLQNILHLLLTLDIGEGPILDEGETPGCMRSHTLVFTLVQSWIALSAVTQYRHSFWHYFFCLLLNITVILLSRIHEHYDLAPFLLTVAEQYAHPFQEIKTDPDLSAVNGPPSCPSLMTAWGRSCPYTQI